MKYLKYLLVLIAVLLLIFILKGFLTPSIYYENEISVDKPIEEAWAVMSDESKLPDWLKGFVKTEHVSGVANTKGAVSNIYVNENGQEMVMQETINKIVPNELINMTFTMDFMDMDYEMTLEESGRNTIIKSKSTTKGNGMFAKSIVSFMTGAIETAEQENLGNLKKVIEENTKNYFPPKIVTEDASTN